MMRNNKFNILDNSDDESEINKNNKKDIKEDNSDEWITNISGRNKKNDKIEIDQNNTKTLYKSSYNNERYNKDRNNNNERYNNERYNNNNNERYNKDKNNNNERYNKGEFLNKDELMNDTKKSWSNTVSSWGNKEISNNSDIKREDKSNTVTFTNNRSKNNEVIKNLDNDKDTRWTTEVSRKKNYEKLPENFALRDLDNQYTIPIGKKSTSKYQDNSSGEEKFIRIAQKRLYECKNVTDALDLCRTLAYEYNKSYNFGVKKYEVEQLRLYMICIYVHMLVKNDNNDTLSELFNKLEYMIKDKNKFLETRKFIILSIWNAYTPIQNASYYLASSCFDNLILWGSNINEKNRDNETVEDMLEAGFNQIKNDDKKRNNLIFYQNSYNKAKERIKYYRSISNNPIKTIEFKDVSNNKSKVESKKNNFDMDKLLKELENYQSNELFLNYLNDQNDHKYHLIVVYLTTINKSIKIDVFKDWFETYLSNLYENVYMDLINRLYNEKHLDKELLLELFDMETMEYINCEAPNVYKQLNILLN